MAGYISEFFGYRAEDSSAEAMTAASRQICPFLGTQCTKVLSRDRVISGVCAVRQKTAGRDFGLYAGRAAIEKA